MMRLCIPTLCRYDLLKRLIESAEAGTVKPSSYQIIDNGGALVVEELAPLLGHLAGAYAVLAGRQAGSSVSIWGHHHSCVVQPPNNLGVAASWNQFIEQAHSPIIISNDDIVLKSDALEKIARDLETHPFVLGYGFALFGITPECVARVGYFDETFSPAYYEDCDYELRMRRAGIDIKRYGPGELAEHEGWATSRAVDDPLILDAPNKNRLHFIAKWGAVTGHCSGGGDDPPLFVEAFNGSPPAGWRRAQKCPPAPMRWDIINAIAHRVGAQRYLEIGVADGESMRNVDILERHGVDPVPSPGGQRACTRYFPYSSKYFFTELTEEKITYDIVFIDGDHREEMVLQEVEWALKVLSPKGIIVLHDCNPTTEAMQTDTYSGGLWNGTVWKAIARLRCSPEHTVRVVDADYGIGIIIPHLAPGYPRELGGELDYATLERERPALLGLLHPSQWEDWLTEALFERERLRKG